MNKSTWDSLCPEGNASEEYCSCHTHYNKEGAKIVANELVDGIG